MGVSSNRKFDRRINDILEGISSNVDSKKFEAAHVDLGKLLGYNASNTEESGGPDPWWSINGDFCLVCEDYTETDGEKPIPTYKVRQLNDHPRWLQNKVENITDKTLILKVLISPSTTIEQAALDIYDGATYYWNQWDFLQWAQSAIQVVRELRLEFNGIGNEEWRTKAIIMYESNGLSPTALKQKLSTSPLSVLKETIEKKV